MVVSRYHWDTTLVILLRGDEPRLGMGARGTAFRRLGSFMDAPALDALPTDRFFPLEEAPLVHAGKKLLVPLLVLHLDVRNPETDRRRRLETLFLGDFPERRVDMGPLFMLPGGGRLRIHGGVAHFL